MSKNLTLTGMMGVGKSTIGKKLAKRLSFGFSDVDTIIEMVEKTTIRNLFNTKGESYFRKIEEKITLKELDKKKVVIEPVKLEQNYRNFDYESPWEGTKYIKKQSDINDKKN